MLTVYFVSSKIIVPQLCYLTEKDVSLINYDYNCRRRNNRSSVQNRYYKSISPSNPFNLEFATTQKVPDYNNLLFINIFHGLSAGASFKDLESVLMFKLFSIFKHTTAFERFRQG